MPIFPSENKLIFLGKMQIPWKNELSKLALILYFNNGESTGYGLMHFKCLFSGAAFADIILFFLSFTRRRTTSTS
jgi:hypothetical protein